MAVANICPWILSFGLIGPLVTEQNELQITSKVTRSQSFVFKSFWEGEREQQQSRVDLIQLMDFILCYGWQLCTVFYGTAYCLMRLL